MARMDVDAHDRAHSKHNASVIARFLGTHPCGYLLSVNFMVSPHPHISQNLGCTGDLCDAY